MIQRAPKEKEKQKLCSLLNNTYKGCEAHIPNMPKRYNISHNV